MTADLVQRIDAALEHPSSLSVSEVAKLLELARSEVRLLRGHLVDASNAFDDCTGEYPQELVSGEGWREAAFELGAGE